MFNQTNIGIVWRATLVGETVERRGGACVGLSERYDAILELKLKLSTLPTRRG